MWNGSQPFVRKFRRNFEKMSEIIQLEIFWQKPAGTFCKNFSSDSAIFPNYNLPMWRTIIRVTVVHYADVVH